VRPQGKPAQLVKVKGRIDVGFELLLQLGRERIAAGTRQDFPGTGIVGQ